MSFNDDQINAYQQMVRQLKEKKEHEIKQIREYWDERRKQTDQTDLLECYEMLEKMEIGRKENEYADKMNAYHEAVQPMFEY
jgi:hypothetical protein